MRICKLFLVIFLAVCLSSSLNATGLALYDFEDNPDGIADDINSYDLTKVGAPSRVTLNPLAISSLYCADNMADDAYWEQPVAVYNAMGTEGVIEFDFFVDSADAYNGRCPIAATNAADNQRFFILFTDAGDITTS